MAVINLSSHPSVSNPERRQNLIHASLAECSTAIALLKCIADSAALGEAEDELTESLYAVHKRLAREITRLYHVL
jgi:hypothetical protein